MSLGEQELDPLYVLIPESLVDPAGLDEEEEQDADDTASESKPNADLTQDELKEILETSHQEDEEESGDESAAEPTADTNAEEVEDDQGEQEEEEGEGVDTDTLRNTLEQSVRNGEEELSDLLGKSLELTEDTFTIKRKADIFAEHQGKIVMTKLLVNGDRNGEIHAIFSMQDAIMLGGTLLMIPEEEINKKIKQNNFGDDEADAFGEIINIWTGALSKVFEEYYPRKLHIKKDRMEPVIPSKLEMDSPDPFPDGEYLLVSYKMQFGTRALGNLEMVFPLSVLDITSREKASILDQAKGISTQAPPAVAILSENREANKAISAILDGMGFEICYITFRENIKDKIRPYNVTAVLLILEEVSEKNLAKLIKLQSLLRSKFPAIVAAPQWTRAQVIQAIKYGAQDIVNTPPDSEVVQNKFWEFAPEQPSTVE
jgi:chemotaxis protein CheY-P-specific phosphatase CheC